jgi:hypothetical protein
MKRILSRVKVIGIEGLFPIGSMVVCLKSSNGYDYHNITNSQRICEVMEHHGDLMMSIAIRGDLLNGKNFRGSISMQYHVECSHFRLATEEELRTCGLV